jgi:hypothetical protein
LSTQPLYPPFRLKRFIEESNSLTAIHSCMQGLVTFVIKSRISCFIIRASLSIGIQRA